MAYSQASLADFESWNVFEYRLPLIRAKPGLGRLSLRVQTEFRFNTRSGGLHQAFARVGPLFDLAPWLFVATQATVYSDRLSDGRYAMEARAELEPNLYGRLGFFNINDRNRMEFRCREARSDWRYRNQLRVNLAPADWAMHPFIWGEVIFDLTGTRVGLSQNRMSVGIGVPFGEGMRLDIGYLMRHRRSPEHQIWIVDQGIFLQLLIDVPPFS